MANFLKRVNSSPRVKNVRAKLRKKRLEVRALGRKYRAACKIESRKLSRKLAKSKKRKKR
jgi:hypothetical protein